MAINFHEKLTDQLDVLERSCQAYDAGYINEAPRIATVLRILFHDTGKSTSLITHLGSAILVQLLSTSEEPPAGTNFFPGITVIHMQIAEDCEDAAVTYKLKLDQARQKRFVSIRHWWAREIVYLNKPQGLAFTRRDIVTTVANQDGGAHVDKALPADYEQLVAGLGWNMTVHPASGAPDKDVLFQNAHYAALRQMGYEVLQSPSLCKLAQRPARSELETSLLRTHTS